MVTSWLKLFTENIHTYVYNVCTKFELYSFFPSKLINVYGKLLKTAPNCDVTVIPQKIFISDIGRRGLVLSKWPDEKGKKPEFL